MATWTDGRGSKEKGPVILYFCLTHQQQGPIGAATMFGSQVWCFSRAPGSSFGHVGGRPASRRDDITLTRAIEATFS